MSSSSATPTPSSASPAPSSTAPNTTPDVATMALGSYYRPMKLLWDVSEFDGSNVTAYLRKYSLMAADCGLVGRAKLDRFSA